MKLVSRLFTFVIFCLLLVSTFEIQLSEFDHSNGEILERKKRDDDNSDVKNEE